jgi:DUF1365 family protein
MAEPKIELIKATVGHTRLWPKNNTFKYRVFYVKTPVTNNPTKTPRLFSFDYFNVLSMWTKDHGNRNKKVGWYQFITNELSKANIKVTNGYRYYLVAHPRILGYAFNPISYWLVINEKGVLQAVLCEVLNTFKQTHNYLLTKADRTPIIATDILVAEKKLYVSPFNKIEGHYEFSFSYDTKQFKSVINYYDKKGRHILNTYVGGKSEDVSSGKIMRLLASYPFMTLMVAVRIHWQALKLYLKSIKATLRFKPKKYQNNETTVSKKQK